MKCILVIEDDRIISRDIEQALKSNGYRVETAKDELDDLRKIKQKTYDLIITDCVMPRMNGEELYKEVFALDRDLAKKIVFASGNITEFIRSTGNTCIAKPYTRKQIIEAVKNLTS
jgi:two-component system nitrogen regulation response regulator NtrX